MSGDWHTPPSPRGMSSESRGYPGRARRPRRLGNETDETGIHQGIGRDGRRAGSRMRDAARHAGECRAGAAQGQGRRPGQGRVGLHRLPGLHPVVRDPDLRAERPRHARARQPEQQDQPRLRLPARPPDPAADLRPGPHQGADEAHQPGQGPRRRSEVGADHLGRGARHRRRQDDGAARRATRRTSSATSAAATRPTSTDLLYGTLPKIFGTGNYFSHSAICAEAEKMGPGLTQGFFGYRDYDLANTNCLVAWGTRPAGLQPHGAERHPPLRRDPQARHGDRGRSAAVELGGQGAGMAAASSRAPTARWPAPSRT